MGDAFDLFEAGFLDESGEYTGQVWGKRKGKAPKKESYSKHNRMNGVTNWLYHNSDKVRIPKNTQYGLGIHIIVKAYGATKGAATLNSSLVAISDDFKSFADWAKEHYRNVPNR